MRGWWVGAGAAVACGPASPEAFELEFARVWCERQQECARGDFERDYASFDACVDHKEDHVDIPHWRDGCELDPEGADACLGFLHQAGCGEWEKRRIEDACEDVYERCDR